MAPLRYRSTRPVKRSNQPALKSSTRHDQRRPKTSVNLEYENSHDENHEAAEFEPDLNELFIQSIEELLPEQEQNPGKSATLAPPPSLERSPLTPGTLIKRERVSDSLPNIYDASPRGHVSKVADLGRRETSRSTAQLTTPASSPEREREIRHLIGEALMVKLEANYEIDGRQSIFGTSCTPPTSSPERNNLPKRPASKRLPTMPQRTPSKAFRAPVDNQCIRQSAGEAERHLNTTILPQKPTLEKYTGLQRTAVVGQQPHALTFKVYKPQKDYEKPALYGSLGKKPSADYLPSLPSSKVFPSTYKITTPSGPVRTVSTRPSTLNESLPAKDNTSKGETCCKLMCLQCTPKDIWEEYGLGPPEKRPKITRLESLSACTSSVSSFGSDDDIPPSNKLHREAGRAVTESSKTFASNRLSEISPSLRYSELVARLELSRPSPADNEDRNDVHNDFEESLPEKDPCRVIFDKVRKVVPNHGQRDVTRTPQRSHSIEDYVGKVEKKRQQIPSWPLRSSSAAKDRSKMLSSLDQQACQEDEDDSSNEVFNNSQVNENCSEDESSGSEYEERTSRKASSQVPKQVKSSGQSIKRAREVIDDRQPMFADDEDMADEDEIVEINRDVFKLSENRRKKRHKSISGEDERMSVQASPAPKEEEVTGNEEISAAVPDYRINEVIGKNTIDNTDQEKIPCDYYMNTYWDHGRASDGRRARDGFTSYVDFKEYCRKNRQPTDDRCVLTYKKDLKHYLLCEYHASLRQDLFRAAWNFEHNPGFHFKSCNKDEETRRIQNEAIGNAPSPASASRGSAISGGVDVEEFVGELLKMVSTSHKEDVAHLTKSNKKLENKVRDLKRKIARKQKR